MFNFNNVNTFWSIKYTKQLKENQPHVMEEGTGELSILCNTMGARKYDNKLFRPSTVSLSLQQK
jgi:hypothetical protein